MLGAAPETRGSIAAVVDAYRAHGLFKRWPIRYLATNHNLALKAARGLLAELAHGAVAVHAHLSVRGFWRDAALVGAALAARAAIRRAMPRSWPRPSPRARRWCCSCTARASSSRMAAR